VTAIFSRVSALALVSVVIGCTAEELPPERGYKGGEFCLDESRWADVINYTKEFGSARGFKFAGGANAYEGAGLNIALLKGGNLFQQETIGLYVVSNPFDRRKAEFFAITRETLTSADTALARRFQAGLSQFACS
jgi:hypothetical protein